MSQDRAASIAEAALEWVDRTSPGGRYRASFKTLSRALTAWPTIPTSSAQPFPETRPFDVDLFRIPPGARPFPRHAHSAQWEYYIVLSGTGRMILEGDGDIAMTAGAHIIQPPGWVHTIENTGSCDLSYYVIATNPCVESVHYPDSGKWAINPFDKVFRM